jgi:hypothetical protein
MVTGFGNVSIRDQSNPHFKGTGAFARASLNLS